VIEGL
jgi:hypothetical protein